MSDAEQSPGENVALSAGEQSTFIERLYRSTKSYADRLSQDELEAIHVDLGVDGYLLEEACERAPTTRRPPRGRTWRAAPVRRVSCFACLVILLLL